MGSYEKQSDFDSLHRSIGMANGNQKLIKFCSFKNTFDPKIVITSTAKPEVMKTRVILFSIVLSVMGSAAFAQVEQDDMYFNSKDRAKLRESRKTADLALASNRKKEKQEEDELNNPKDTYSARNVNPEFTSRSHSKSAQEDEEDYFVNNYQYSGNQFSNAGQYNNWNNNYNNWYGNSWYRNNYWSPSINAWNSPYYGYYDSFNSPWYDPYWSQNGWSSSFSFYYGSNWNYGWGGNYNYWNRPYCPGWNSYYSSNAYWNSYRYPSTIVVINNNESAGRGVSYGKRPTRGSSIVSNRNESRSRQSISNPPDNNSGGRSSSNGRTQSGEYYNRSWRYNNSQPATTQDSRSNTQNNRPNSNWSNSNNNSWNNSSNERTYTAPSRSNSSSDGGGTRTNSGSSGSGSNGRTRGRD
jgi:hypothetical protein